MRGGIGLAVGERIINLFLKNKKSKKIICKNAHMSEQFYSLKKKQNIYVNTCYRLFPSDKSV